VQPGVIAIYVVSGSVAFIGVIAVVVQALIIPSAAVAPVSAAAAGGNFGSLVVNPVLAHVSLASRFPDPAAIIMDRRFIEYKV
jgi:uncharacterized membrane protein